MQKIIPNLWFDGAAAMRCCDCNSDAEGGRTAVQRRSLIQILSTEAVTQICDTQLEH